MNHFVFVFAIFIFCQSAKAQIFTTTTTVLPTTTTTVVPGFSVTLAPGVTINNTLLTQRPDENAVNALLSYLPEDQQTNIRNIRGNIFLTLSQQNDQVRDYLSQQNGNSSAVYQQIQNMTQQLSQNITNSFASLSAPGQSFVQRRQEVLDNNGIALFDYNGRLQSLLNEFNSYNDSLKNEIYNFLVTRQISGTFIPDLTSTHSFSLPVTLDGTTENQLMNLLFLDGANQPIRGFVQLIPQEQQNQFNNIIGNSNLRKSQVAQQLQDLVSSWGPQYEMAYNSTLVQRNQMVQLLMFLRPGLMEPYKSFITHKLDLMTNMTLTTAQEAQAIQSLISGFTSVRTTLNNYINGTNTSVLGR